jgi:alanine racemase
MDQIVVDVSMVPDAALGDEATLIGSDGSAKIDIFELARQADTIPWEILTGIGPRVKHFQT